MKVTVLRDGAACDYGDWHVWAHLDEEHPLHSRTSFIVGIGATREEAIESAVGDLEACIESLQASSRSLPERSSSSEGSRRAAAESEAIISDHVRHR